MCVCIYTHTHICIYTYMYICIHIRYTYTYIYMYMCICTPTHEHRYVYSQCVCMCVYVCVCEEMWMWTEASSGYHKDSFDETKTSIHGFTRGVGVIDWVLQCVAVECSVLQYTLGLILDVALGVRARLDRRKPMCFSVVLCVATCCSVVDIKVLSRGAYAYVLWCVAAF